MKPILEKLLACPVCSGDVTVHPADVVCVRCGKGFPIVRGVPIMTPGGTYDPAPQPPDRDGYDPWIHRRTMATLLGALGDRAAILDLGSGNMRLDLQGVIRMDASLTDQVDLVADAHHLPFRDHALDMVFSLSVLEHLSDPFRAADEMYRVLKAGGYVYHDTNFVFPYHGYPHHYFNFSPQGIAKVFRKFRMIHQGVPPYNLPSFALEGLVTSYVYTLLSLPRRGVTVWHRVLDLGVLAALLAVGSRRVWSRFDSRFGEKSYVVAAGVYWYGIKQPGGDESLIPSEVTCRYRQEHDLQVRYPEPLDLSQPDNLVSRVLGLDIDSPAWKDAAYVEIDSMRRAHRAKGRKALWAYLAGHDLRV